MRFITATVHSTRVVCTTILFLSFTLFVLFLCSLSFVLAFPLSLSDEEIGVSLSLSSLSDFLRKLLTRYVFIGNILA